jgi:hypothetical protein
VTTTEQRTARANPRKGHATIATAAVYFQKSRRWVMERGKRGDLELFVWSATDKTVSWASIYAFEDRHRVSAKPITFRKCLANSE